MHDLAVPKESRQHRESLICERLIDERLLPFKRFNGTAHWKVVRIVEKRRDDLGEQSATVGACQAFCDCGHSWVVQVRIARHPQGCRGPANRCAFEERRLRDFEPRGAVCPRRK